MSYPQSPPASGMSDAYPAYGADPAWTPPPAPSWAPAWHPPAGPVQTGPALLPAKRTRELLVPVLAGVGGLLLGVLATGVVVAAVATGDAESVREVVAEELADVPVDPYTPDFSDPDLIEKFDPIAPQALGDDPALDRYAQDCFEGDLQACDDLYWLSSPMTGYEQYAVTCGGRVREYSLMYCSDFE
jgi:hypothetical protein